MKRFLSFLLLLSIALSVGFLTGCRTIRKCVHNYILLYGSAPCEFCSANHVSQTQSKDADKVQLTRIATLLDIPTSGKSASDLESDILYKLDRRTPVPTALDQTAYDNLSKRLLTAEKPVLRDYQQFIFDLQGKRVIVIEPEN